MPAGHNAGGGEHRLLVPAADFDGDVHSVFARACNLALAGAILAYVGLIHGAPLGWVAYLME